jgi:hypothetical protein
VRRNAIVVAVSAVILSLCTCCIAGGLWWDGYYLPYKPCRPLTYPDGKVVTEATSSTTLISIDTVEKYYDQRLAVKPDQAETGHWRRRNVPNARVFYDCPATDINRLSTETGCIYLWSSDGKTYIQTLLLRSEGGNDQCP